MTAQQLVSDFAARGIGLEARGARILIHDRSKILTDADRARIREHRAGLLLALSLPGEAELIERCRPACRGTVVDPAALARWLIRQRDPDWCEPAAIAAWVRVAVREGGLPE